MTKPASLIPNSASSHQHHVEATSPANVAYYQQHSSSSFSRSNEAQESNHQVYQASSTTHVGSSGDFSSNAHTNQLVIFPVEPRPGAPPTMPSVSRACSNCKKSHLGCDFARPCKRCVSVKEAPMGGVKGLEKFPAQKFLTHLVPSPFPFYSLPPSL